MANRDKPLSVRRDKDFEDDDMRLEEPFMDENDGRDGTPGPGSDDPDSLDLMDPLKRTRNNVREAYDGMDGAAAVTDLTEKDDGPRW
ncbi:MAG: hypothetical protein ACTII7_04145 [Galactobacter sp.]